MLIAKARDLHRFGLPRAIKSGFAVINEDRTLYFRDSLGNQITHWDPEYRAVTKWQESLKLETIVRMQKELAADQTVGLEPETRAAPAAPPHPELQASKASNTAKAKRKRKHATQATPKASKPEECKSDEPLVLLDKETDPMLKRARWSEDLDQEMAEALTVAKEAELKNEENKYYCDAWLKILAQVEALEQDVKIGEGKNAQIREQLETLTTTLQDKQVEHKEQLQRKDDELVGIKEKLQAANIGHQTECESNKDLSQMANRLRKMLDAERILTQQKIARIAKLEDLCAQKNRAIETLTASTARFDSISKAMSARSGVVIPAKKPGTVTN